MMRMLLFFLLAVVFSSSSESTEEVLETMEPTTDDEGEDISRHVAVIRPDYTLWRMVKVLRNMFDSKTEKRRQRDLREESEREELRSEPIRQQALRARRLLFNF